MLFRSRAGAYPDKTDAAFGGRSAAGEIERRVGRKDRDRHGKNDKRGGVSVRQDCGIGDRARVRGVIHDVRPYEEGGKAVVRSYRDGGDTRYGCRRVNVKRHRRGQRCVAGGTPDGRENAQSDEVRHAK